jgi:peptide chain release factor 2
MFFRMYQRERRGYKVDITTTRRARPGSNVTCSSPSTRSGPQVEPASTAWWISLDSARRHTACRGFAWPELDDHRYRDPRQGPAGRHLPAERSGRPARERTDSAVRITHLPTNIVVACQNERSQIRNREVARKVLKSRLFDLEMKKQREKLDIVEAAKMQIAFGSQIRSYVLHPYRMVKDHRTKCETGDVDRVLDGDLDIFIKAALVAKARGELSKGVSASEE